MEFIFLHYFGGKLYYTAGGRCVLHVSYSHCSACCLAIDYHSMFGYNNIAVSCSIIQVHTFYILHVMHKYEQLICYCDIVLSLTRLSWYLQGLFHTKFKQ